VVHHAHQGNALVFLATVIRTIPCWAPAHLRANFYMQWTLHVGTLTTAQPLLPHLAISTSPPSTRAQVRY
jgi:hypothetical protein